VEANIAVLAKKILSSVPKHPTQVIRKVLHAAPLRELLDLLKMITKTIEFCEISSDIINDDSIDLDDDLSGNNANDDYNFIN